MSKATFYCLRSFRLQFTPEATNIKCIKTVGKSIKHTTHIEHIFVVDAPSTTPGEQPPRTSNRIEGPHFSVCTLPQDAASVTSEAFNTSLFIGCCVSVEHASKALILEKPHKAAVAVDIVAQSCLVGFGFGQVVNHLAWLNTIPQPRVAESGSVT